MSRILVLGYELPGMADGPVEARSYRTWQFVEPLLACGHQVCLIASHRTNQLDVSHSLGSSLSYHRLNLREVSWLKRANAISDRFQPDATLSIMSFPFKIQRNLFSRGHSNRSSLRTGGKGRSALTSASSNMVCVQI